MEIHVCTWTALEVVNLQPWSVGDDRTWSSIKGSTHLTLQLYNLAIPVKPPGLVCGCVCTHVWGMGVKKREHWRQEYCVVFSGPDGLLGGSAAVLPGQIPPPDNEDIYYCCMQRNGISHTIRIPLAEDTHARTLTCLRCNKTLPGWGEVLVAH